MDKLLQVKSDIVFHDLINKDNKNIIEWIVMKILNLDYKDVHNKCKLIDSRITRISNNDKVKHVDIIIEYEDYEIILELNRNFKGNIIRNLVYGMTRIVDCYKKYDYIDRKDYQKNYYNEKIKVIIVNLNWERENVLTKKLINNSEIIHGMIWSKRILLKVINVPLDKYANMPYNEVKEKERFYKLLTITKIEDLNKIVKDEPLTKEYINKLIKLCKDEKYLKEVEDMTEGMEKYFLDQQAYEMGEEKGINIGIEKNQHNIVLNMYKDNVPFKTISKYTKLSINKIKEIINNKNK